MAGGMPFQLLQRHAPQCPLGLHGAMPVEQDYKYLKGWYEEDWHWVRLEVTQMIDGKPDFEHVYNVGGYESSLPLDTDLVEDKVSTINEAIKELEWEKRRSLHPGQLELQLHVPLT